MAIIWTISIEATTAAFITDPPLAVPALSFFYKSIKRNLYVNIELSL